LNISHRSKKKRIREDNKYMLASFAILAPIRTQQLIPRTSVISLEIIHDPSFFTSIPLIREIALASGLIFPTSLLQIPLKYECGVTNTNISASFTETPQKEVEY
jgi:hypothetical protein